MCWLAPGITRAMPEPVQASATITTRSDVEASTVARSANPTAMIRKPGAEHVAHTEAADEGRTARGDDHQRGGVREDAEAGLEGE